MRIAFTLIGGERWHGGRQYLLNLLRAIEMTEIEPILFVGDNIEDQELEAFLGIRVKIVKNKIFSNENKKKLLLKRLLFGKDKATQDIYKLEGIDLIFQVSTFYGWRSQIKTLLWIPDFQHRFLPEMFGWLQYIKREIWLRLQMSMADSIMLSSMESVHNCKELYKILNKRLFAVPFAVNISHANVDFNKLKFEYNLPDNFFYLPNQFWRHKNHKIVIDALSILKNKGVKVAIVASGQSFDGRNPNYFQNLFDEIEKYGLNDCFLYIGVIPYSHVISIMRNSIAVINPSFFEGWSTTVEEAKSLGIRLILSNIPVHREQVANALFFDPAVASELADILEKCSTGIVAVEESAAYESNVRQFGLNFLNTTREVYAQK